MNIATRGYGSTQLIPTWGYGPEPVTDVTPKPGGILEKDRIPLKRVVEKRFELELYAPVMFQKETSYPYTVSILRTDEMVLNYSSELLKSNQMNLLLNASVGKQGIETIPYSMIMSNKKLIRTLKAI